MPYDASRDPFVTTQNSPLAFGRTAAVVTPSGTDFTVYPKALVVVVPTGTASPTVTILPAKAADGATEVISLPEGITVIDWVLVRGVTAAAAGVVVRRIDD